ncbi:MAG: hypothetical protein H6Q05_3652 [Acidobacteria bacterium]|nr:hypothetical protein [Acidobacteriota bacterium]
MKNRLMILAICLCAALVAGLAKENSGMQKQGTNAAAAQGKPAPGPGPTSMYFSNRDGDKIRGDNDINGPYVNGVRNVKCVVYQGGYESNEFLLNLYKSSNPKRYVQYDFDTPAECNPLEGGIGSVRDTGFLRVVHVGDAPVGVPVARNSVFYSPTVGYINGAAEPCNAAAVVLRLDRYNWIVSTDQTYGSPLPNFVGNLVPIGDIRVINTYTYHMPWEMHINCPSCVCAPNDPNCK